MPRLAQLRAAGASGTLRSTVPTYTPPAWTSAVTGVNPGRHGIYGFHVSNAQSEKMKLAHSGLIKSPALWEMSNAQGARVGMFNLPLTYPPQPLDGWMVSGMMTPGYGHQLKGFVYPNDLEAKVLSWVPDYEVEIKTSWDLDWRDESFAQRALVSLEHRYTVLARLLELDPCDIVFTVIETPDRLQHAYYRYMDPEDPAYDSDMGKRVRPHLEKCFAAIDRIAGLLVDHADGGGVIVCSDHGFTGWDVSVHTNVLLQQWGFQSLKQGSRVLQSKAARALVPLAKRVLPAKVAREAKGKLFDAIDWSRTRAFASPIPQQGVFVNLEGREPRGIVPMGELGAIKDDLVARFEALTGPDGAPVTDVVHRSEEVFSGDELEGAPDVLPVLRDHRYELDDEIFHTDPFTDTSELPRGVHHPDGIVVVAGEGAQAGGRVDGSIMDVMPTLLYLAGLEIPTDLDGAVLDAFTDEHKNTRGPRYGSPLDKRERDESSPYSAEEEALIEESLRGLGYL